MQRNFLNEASKYIKSNRRHRVRQKIVRVLAGCVVFCTTYALILPAITKEQDTFCGYEEHTHSEECYVHTSRAMKLTCSPDKLGLHVHSESCLGADGKIVCGLADYVVHTHNADCVDANGVLVCTFPEAGQHVHDSSCYSVPEDSAQSHTHTETCNAAEKQLVCTKEESDGHVHSDDCYTTETVTTCTLEESAGHTHTAECYITENALTCTTSESAEHTHGDDCYTAQQNLICGQNEQEAHTHGDGCYTVQQNLTCGQTEQEAHAHSDSCYETPIICGLEEAPASEPELVCTAPIAEVHVHSADCFEAVEEPLTCQLAESEEHTHSALCYGTWKLICPKEEHTHELACFSDPEADVETAEVWERTFANVKLTGVWADDVLAIAKTQLGYTESTRNYYVAEDNSIHGYTRYGDWYGLPYGDWCAMFVSYCIHYAEIDGVPLNCGCWTWIDELSKEEIDLYREAGEYDPKPGDIIFFDWEDENGYSDDLADHVGLVVELIPATGTEPAKIKTIEGNSADRVINNTYDADDTQILGYGIMPENPDLDAEVETNNALYTYTDDTVYVEVQLPEDTSVPADAVLQVTPIESTDDGYSDYLVQAEEAVEGFVTNIALYDISFYTADGTYYPVDDTAKVTMGFVESPVDAAGNVQVLHFEEEDAVPQILDDVTFEEKEIEMILDDAEQANTPAAAELEQQSLLSMLARAVTQTPDETEPEVETFTETRSVLEFETPGFSTFAVVEVETGTYITQVLRNADVQNDKLNNLGGRIFVISPGFGYDDFNGVHFALTNEQVIVHEISEGDSHEYERLKAGAVQYDNSTLITPADDGFLWRFIKVADKDNTYYVQSVETGEYLYIGTGRTVQTMDTPQEIVVAYYGAAGDNGRVTLMGENGYYLRCTNESNEEGIKAFSCVIGGGWNELFLAEYGGETSSEPLDQWPFDGQQVVISRKIDNQSTAVLTSTARTGNESGEVNLLTAVNRTATSDANGNIVSVFLNSGENNTAVWKLTAVAGKPNHYQIQLVGDNGGYLNLNTNHDLTVGTEPQDIELYATDNGNTVALKIPGAYVHLYGNDIGRGFGCWDNFSNECYLSLTEYTETDLDLNGKEFVISLRLGDNSAAVLTNEDKTDGQVQVLKAVQANATTDAYNVNFVPLSETSRSSAWKFTKVGDTGNIYTIQSKETGEYLQLNANHNLVVGNDAQNIEVCSTGIGNTVALRIPDTTNYVHLYGSDPNRGFGCWGDYNTECYLSLTDYFEGLDGQEFIISFRLGDNNAAVLKNEQVADPDYGNAGYNNLNNHQLKLLKAVETAATTDQNNVININSELLGYNPYRSVWKFIKVGDNHNTYYIQSMETGEYLQLNQNHDLVVGDEAQLIEVYRTGVGDTVMFRIPDANAASGYDYVHLYGRNTNRGFGCWDDYTDECYLSLTEYIDQLDGKELVISWLNAEKTQATVMTSDTIPDSAANGYVRNLLRALNKTATTDADGKLSYVDLGADVEKSVWTFTKVEGQPYTYYIQATFAETTQYLALADRNESDVAANRVGSDLTLSGDSQAIKVTYNNDGTVILSASVNGVTRYVNYYGADINRGFGCWDTGTQLWLTEYAPTDLNGRQFIISKLLEGNYTAVMTRYMENQTLVASAATYKQLDENGNPVPANDAVIGNDILWQFEAVQDGNSYTYYIKAADGSGYLNIAFDAESNEGSLTVGNDPQPIEVVNTNGNGVALRLPNTDYYVSLTYAPAVGDNGTFGTVENINANSTLALTEYPVTNQVPDSIEDQIPDEKPDPVPDPEPVVDKLVTNLADQMVIICAVDSVQNDPGVVTDVATNIDDNGANRLGLETVAVNEANGITINNDAGTVNFSDADPDVDYSRMIWKFISTDTPGVYYIQSQSTVEGAGGKYLHLDATGATLNEKPQAIEAVMGTTTGGWKNVVCLRVTDDNGTHYLNLCQNNPGLGVTTYAGAGTGNNGNHFILAQLSEGDLTTIKAIMESIDALPNQEEIVRAVMDLRNAGADSAAYQAQVIADAIKAINTYNAAKDTLTAEEKVFIGAYRIRKLEELEEWLLETTEDGTLIGRLPNVVPSIAAPGVTMKVFNYTDDVTKEEFYNQGFRFFQLFGNSVDGAGLFEGTYINTLPGTATFKLNDQGYPVLVDGETEIDLSNLFNGTYQQGTMTNGGGLFQRDEDGYYYYYSDMNAAYFDGSNFVLYDTIVRPSNIWWSNPNIDPEPSDRRSNFLPFNELINADDGTSSIVYDSEEHQNENEENMDVYHELSLTDQPDQVPSAILNDPTDLWFGMSMEFDFNMPEGGLVNDGDHMIFDFHGDDDVWVFIDDVLILDIGGTHAAQNGTIDFATGKVYSPRTGNTTLKELFCKAAGVDYGPGVEEVTINGKTITFTGDTLADNTPHNLKFFYMERGGTISYCGLKFNMLPLPKASLSLTKEVEGVGDDDVYDEEYTFELFDIVQPYDSTRLDTDGVIKEVSYDIVAKDGTLVKPAQVLKLTPQTETVRLHVTQIKETSDDEQIRTVDEYVEGTFDVCRYYNTNTSRGLTGDATYIQVYRSVENEQIWFYSNMGGDNYRKTLVGTSDPDNDDNFYKVYKSETFALKSGETADFSEFITGTLVRVREYPVTSGVALDINYWWNVSDNSGTDLENGVYQGTLESNGAWTSQYIKVEDDTQVDIVCKNILQPVNLGIRKVLLSPSGGQSVDYATTFSIKYTIEYPNSEYLVVETDEDGVSTIYKGVLTNGKIEKGAQLRTTNEETWTLKNKETYDDPITPAGKAENAPTVNEYMWTTNIPFGSIITIQELQVDGYEVAWSYEGWDNVILTEDGTEEGTNGPVYQQRYTNSGDGAVIDGIKLLATDNYVTIYNTPLPDVTVEKTVVGTNTSGTFDFTYNMWNAQAQQIEPDGSLTGLVNGGSKKITPVSKGSKIVIKETDESAAGYDTTYEVYSHYEAEEAALGGKAVLSDDNKAVINLGGADNGTVTFTVNAPKQGKYKLTLRYNQADTRSFGVSIGNSIDNTTQTYVVPCENTGDWDTTWEDVTLEVDLKLGTNTIEIGRGDHEFAPNLDYIEILWQTGTGTEVTVENIVDPVRIHYINHEGYELPETGGTGTYLYTMGGLLLITAAAILLYIHTKRGKEDYASS